VLGGGVHSVVHKFFSVVIGTRKLFFMTVRSVVTIVVEIKSKFLKIYLC